MGLLIKQEFERMINVEKSIVDKIKKLISLSSDNKHEAESAMLKAQKLLAKHNLTLAEVNEHTKQNVIEDITDISFKSGKEHLHQ